MFSTVRVAIVVVESVSPPTDVSEFANTSPSASTRNRTAPLTATPSRFVSEDADAGLMTSDALVTFEPLAPIDHAGKVWAFGGTYVAISGAENVDVAEAEIPAPENPPLESQLIHTLPMAIEPKMLKVFCIVEVPVPPT